MNNSRVTNDKIGSRVIILLAYACAASPSLVSFLKDHVGESSNGEFSDRNASPVVVFSLYYRLPQTNEPHSRAEATRRKNRNSKQKIPSVAPEIAAYIDESVT